MPSAGGHCGNAAMLARPNATARDGYGNMGIAGAGSTDGDTVALRRKKIALSEIAHQALVDERSAHQINFHGGSFACRLTTGLPQTVDRLIAVVRRAPASTFTDY